MICSKCYRVVDDDAIACPFCGCATKNEAPAIKDETNVALAFLSLLLGIFFDQGLIFGVLLWAAKSDLQPKSARVYGILGILPWFLRWLIPAVTRLIRKVVFTVVSVLLLIAGVVTVGVLMYLGIIPVPPIAL